MFINKTLADTMKKRQQIISSYEIIGCWKILVTHKCKNKHLLVEYKAHGMCG